MRLAAKLRKSHFLFLGYGLRDWNLRVILHRLWGEQRLHYKSWAIQLDPQIIDQEFWRERDVDIIDVALEDYVTHLGQRLRELPTSGGGTHDDRGGTSSRQSLHGTGPYSEEDAAFFFGREVEQEIIAANLQAYRLTLLVWRQWSRQELGAARRRRAPSPSDRRPDSVRRRRARVRGRRLQFLARRSDCDPRCSHPRLDRAASAPNVAAPALSGNSFVDALESWTTHSTAISWLFSTSSKNTSSTIRRRTAKVLSQLSSPARSAGRASA